MIVYIDSDFVCHTENADGRRMFDVPFFDGKCETLVNGYRYVPSGETWTRSDGVQFVGEMITPAKTYSLLASAQAQYDIDDAKNTQETANLVDEIYNEDLEVIG